MTETLKFTYKISWNIFPPWVNLAGRIIQDNCELQNQKYSSAV